MRHPRLQLATAAVAGALILAGCTSSSGAGASKSTSSVASPGTVTATTTGSPTSGGSSGSVEPSHSSPTSGPAPKLTDFRIADVTWVGNEGWALGAAQCLSGKGVCDAIEHTADSGATWASLPAPRAGINLPNTVPRCDGVCVSGLRFATSSVGYAFGGFVNPGVLFLTTDGGRHWARQAGGAVAVESADGNVVRITGDGGGCPGPCDLGAQTADIGATQWTTRRLPRTSDSFGIDVTRHGPDVYLLVEGHVAGGGEHAYSSLYRSVDDGHTWSSRGEPCPQRSGREYDSSLPSAAPDGALYLLCSQRGGSGARFLIRSSDGGAHFTAAAASLGAAFPQAVGAVSSRVVLVSADATYRSVDGGQRFRKVGGPGQLASLSFSSASVGHGVSMDGRTLWTTRDGGRTWAAHRFA